MLPGEPSVLPPLFVLWRHPISRKTFPVGRLAAHRFEDLSIFEFVYLRGALDAHQEGFRPFLSFPQLERAYRSERLFPFFENRLMPSKRPEYNAYLYALGLEPQTASPIAVLARSGGTRQTDQLEVFPMPRRDRETQA